MKVLFLIVNTACDMACKHCFYTTGYEKRSQKRISPDKAHLFAQKIREHGFEIVILTGGDPFVSRLKSETYVLIEALKNQSLKVIINTSGVKMTEIDLTNIINLGVNRVDLSINSCVEEIHNAERGFFHDTVWFLQELLAKKPEIVSTTTVITKENAKYAVDTLLWLKNMGVKNINYQPVFMPLESPSDTIMQTLEKCAEILSAKHTRDYLAQYAAASHNQGLLSNAVCKMGKKYFVCDSDGTLYPCFHRMDITYGNVLVDAKEDIERTAAQDPFNSDQVSTCFGPHCVSLFDNSDFWR